MPDERHKDYELVFGNLNPATVSPAQQFKVNSDGPFCLREIALTGAGGQSISSFGVKFTDPFNRFLEQDYIAMHGEIPYGGSWPVLTPMIPQLIYPPNSNIVAYLNNTNPLDELVNGRVLFRGVTLFPDQTVLNRQQYPKYFREMPYRFPQKVTQSITPSNDNIVNVTSDADFAMRGFLITQPGPAFNSFLGLDFTIEIKDQNGKLYQGDTTKTTPVFFNSIAGEAMAHRPGLFEPEIYLPKNSSFYFDLVSPAGSLPFTFYISFFGAKIFESSTPC
jgi:hypothetical protein